MPTGKLINGTVITDSDPLQVAMIGEDGSTVRSRLITVATEFTRPNDTTAYAAGDVVSNSTSATTLQPIAIGRVNGGSGYIVGARLTTDQKSITPRIRIHLFNASDPTVAADNAAHKALYADGGKRLGYVDLPPMTTPTDTTNSDLSGSLSLGLRVPFVCADGTANVWFLLEALDAFTPAANKKFRLSLTVDVN